MKFGRCNQYLYLMEFIFLPVVYDFIFLILYELVNNKDVQVYSYQIPDMDLYLLLWVNIGLTTFVMIPSYIHQMLVIYYGSKEFRINRLMHHTVYFFHGLFYTILYYLCIIDLWNGILICLLIVFCIVCIFLRDYMKNKEESEEEMLALLPH